ncbi:MAG: RimK family alpha-L-glutamate ligase [Planctomycetes bacterium]|nr:RimK family alpha-L-glutamate ligase [Planctomycetota bacterium]
MRIVALSGNTGAGGWHVSDLARAATLVGHTVTAVGWRSLHARIDDTRDVIMAGDTPLAEADLLLMRTMPPGTLEQIVFRMDLVHRLALSGVRVVNPPAAIEAAVDKYLTLARLRDAGVPVPQTIACQRFTEAIDALHALGGDVVVKPMFGSEGFGMLRLTDPDLAARVFATLDRTGSVIYLQRFIDHGGEDFRLFVLNGRVIAAMRRINRKDWRTNVARGGCGEAITPDPVMIDLAVRSAAACGAIVAGIDVVIDGGKPVVIEVNAVPGWRELTRVTGIDIAALLLRELAGGAA